MKRRNFLKYTAPLAATPLMLTGAPGIRPFATPKMLAALTDDCDVVKERVLVLIQLKGGNDGLNTVIPIEQYDTYANLRPNLKFNESDLVNLDTTLAIEDQVALSPAMTEISDMYNEGKVNIIQGVNYDNPNLSHFHSRDLYWTGSDGLPENAPLNTGWIGRYLDSAFPGLAGNPIEVMQDPLGIQLGDSKSALGFASENPNDIAINLYGQDPGGLFSLVNSVGGEPIANVPDTEYGNELQYIMNVENSVEVYAQRITEVFTEGTNSGVTYPDTDLANQLKTIARLMDGGSKTKVFLASIDGFDTHQGQIVSGNSLSGLHYELWQTVSQAVKAFTDDLTNLGLEERVLTSTFSEFGRRSLENGSLGTDHGTTSNMMVFGSMVNAGILGTNVDLSGTLSGAQLEEKQHDYRQVFTTLLQDWLGASDDMLNIAFPTDTFAKIPLVTTAAIADPDCYGAIALPIELLSFSAVPVNNRRVAVEWETTLEIDADRFEIQRSRDTHNFVTIMREPAKGEASVYEVYDNEPLPGTSYYRLKQIENNGKFTFSAIKKVDIKHEALKNLRLAPNPARINTYVTMTANEDVSATLRVVSLQGMIHRNEPLEIRKGFNKISLECDRLSAGMYSVILEDRAGRIIGEERLMVQN